MKRETKLEVTGVDHDYGTVIVLTGVDDKGDKYSFGADRRPALDIIAAMEVGELPEVWVEDWQLIQVPERRADK